MYPLAARGVIIDLCVEIFAPSRTTGEVRCGDGRGGGALGKAAEALKNLSMTGCMLNTTKHLAVLGFVFGTATGLLTFEGVKGISCYT
jgi:hypothetical protein